MDFDTSVQKLNDYLNEQSNDNLKRFIVDVNHMRQTDKDLVDFILNDPLTILPMAAISPLGFKGAFGSNFVTPRSINSTCIGKLICCQGIVTSVSLVRPKIIKSIHYDENNKTFFQKEYRDRTMLTNLPPTTTAYPSIYDGNILASEYGLSKYMDFQTFVLQEMPEKSPPGQLPRSIECIVSDDLVDQFKPGDRIDVFGIYKSFSIDGYSSFPTQFKIVLIANNIMKLRNTSLSSSFELDKIKMVADSSIKFKAIASTIFGHDEIKKALALQMVGGNEVIMKNGARIRGDINILLIGDPSTAKSQLLRYTMNFMPLTIATTGRGSTGVGLTAAVVLDKDTGDKRLEAGAMVLGDRGIVCIDEFDKMDDDDRVAIHEVMEQQTVTIAKAGIHTTLNARCSVLAAANPVFGVYNGSMSPQDNVKLPESLMTRFDLVFVTLDNKGVEIDNLIATHVLKMHRKIVEEEDAPISQDLFREYILYAKSLVPKLSRGAASIISQSYSKMRENKDGKSLIVNVTPRLLETMIRLATANAKLRLSETVEAEDANEIVNLITENLIKKKIVRKQERKNVKVVVNTTKAPEPVKEETPVEIDGQLRDNLLDTIWNWKENNSTAEFCDLKALAEESKLEFNLLKQVAEELASQDIIMMEDDKIYFLD